MDEKRMREIANEELDRREEAFPVSREQIYKYIKQLAEIDASGVSHLDQHKWLAKFISIWNRAAFKIGNFLLVIFASAIAIIVTWAAAIWLKIF